MPTETVKHTPEMLHKHRNCSPGLCAIAYAMAAGQQTLDQNDAANAEIQRYLAAKDEVMALMRRLALRGQIGCQDLIRKVEGS